jgi:hypothetical protein
MVVESAALDVRFARDHLPPASKTGERLWRVRMDHHTLDASGLMARPTGQPPVELWDGTGRRVLTAGRPPVPRGTTPVPLPDAPSLSGPGLSAFQVSGDIVFRDAVVEVPSPEIPPSAPGRIGYVFVRRLLTSAAASNVLGRLVGTGAVIAIGNQTGSAWTACRRSCRPLV